MHRGPTGRICFLLTHEHLSFILNNSHVFAESQKAEPNSTQSLQWFCVACGFLFSLLRRLFATEHAPNIYILFEEGFLLPTLISPTHRMVPGTQCIQERERRVENGKKTPDSKRSPIWWWSFSLLLIQPEMIFTLLKPCLWTYQNLTVHRIHIVLPSHMFTIYTGTSGNPYSTEICSFLNGSIPPARASFGLWIRPLPSMLPVSRFHVILTRTPYKGWPGHTLVWQPPGNDLPFTTCLATWGINPTAVQNQSPGIQHTE